jgi:prepilin-type N-terminal cleavage/methylation domain-containing protein
MPSAPTVTLPPRQPRGFTIIELLVVIAILGLLISLVLPSVQSAREKSNSIKAANTAKTICLVLHNEFLLQRRSLPENLAAIKDRLEEENIEIHKILPDGRVVAEGYIFELLQFRVDIEAHLLFLETLGESGLEAARYFRRLQTQFLVFARPAVRGRTGCHLAYAGHDCHTFLVLDPECAALQEEMFRRLQEQALYHTGRLLISDPTQARFVLPVLKDPQTVTGTFTLLDTSGDAKVTFRELRELSRRPLAATADGGENPLTILQEFLRYALEDEMQVGAAGENVEDIGVTLEDLPDGDLTALISAANFARLIDDLVPEEGLANSLIVKVQVAQSLRRKAEAADPADRDNLAAACTSVVRALRSEIQAQADKGILLEDAIVLDAAVGVLCPDPADP